MFLKIKGIHTHFENSTSVVTFSPRNSVFAFSPKVEDIENISMIIFIMPRWFTGPISGPIEGMVTTDDEEVSGAFDLKLIPFALDGKKDRL